MRYARSIRGFFVAQAGIGLLTTACVIAFAWALTLVVTRAIDGAPIGELAPLIAALVGIAAVRAAAVWASETASMRAAGRVKSELRTALLDAVRTLGPARLAARGSTSVATLAGRGMDALDDYFGKYLPQLVLTCLVTPVLVIVIWSQDWISGLVIVITLPLIPVFMALIGWATMTAQQRQWDTLGRLSSGFVDLLGGIATLKIFGRQHRQVARMREITEEYRGSTMRVLRVTFLSGFVLELASSLAVAIVAVAIGLRLIAGELTLEVGLFVLLLAPDAFLPLRNVGTNFHAAAEGVTAAKEVFEILDEAAATPAAAPTPAPGTLRAGLALSLRGARAMYPPSGGAPPGGSADGPAADSEGGRAGALAPVPHVPVTAEVAPGTLAALAGPSGIGKSSLAAALAGFTPYEGELLLGGVDLAGIAPSERDWLAWAPQRAALHAGTVAENVALGDESPRAELVDWALRAAAAAEVDPATELGLAGTGLSGGQAQRVGIARALYRARRRGCALMILDEPTSALDHDTEATLLANLRAVARGHDGEAEGTGGAGPRPGPAILMISHREAVLAAADRVIAMEPEPALVGAASAVQDASVSAPGAAAPGSPSPEGSVSA